MQRARKILHADLDAYYAQVEQRDDPALRGRPVAVGKDGSRGVVMTASYEARRFGVGSALPVAHAKRLCPELVVVPARMEVYRRDSLRIREIFARYTDLIEPLALDEAYLDVTTPKEGPPSGTLLARSIRRDVAEGVGLTVSVGVSYCKFLAKLASGLDKPDGLSVIRPEDAAQLLPTLPVGAFLGVGPKTAVRLGELGIYTGADLLKHSREVLGHHFGKQGHYLFDVVRGIDERPVTPNRARKSLGAERTCGRDLTTPAALAAELLPLAELLAGRLEGAGMEAGNVIVKLKLASFQLVTRRLPLPRPTADAQVLGRVAAQILSTRLTPHQLASSQAYAVRLLGLQSDQLVSGGRECSYPVPLFPQL